jgi:hypothetical protein
MTIRKIERVTYLADPRDGGTAGGMSDRTGRVVICPIPVPSLMSWRLPTAHCGLSRHVATAPLSHGPETRPSSTTASQVHACSFSSATGSEEQ